MCFIPRLWLKVVPFALLAFLASAGIAGSAATRDVKPFTYIFIVKSVTATGTFTTVNAETGATGTSTIRVHLDKPTKKIYLTWLGKRDGGMHNGSGSSGIKFVGEAVFKDSAKPSCNKTFPITSAGSHPFAGFILGYARERVVTHPTFAGMVGRFPMVTGYPAQPDGPCGRVRKDWWETAHGSFPFPAIVKKKNFALRGRQPKRDLGDGESVEWSLVMKVHKVRFIPISCKIAHGC